MKLLSSLALALIFFQISADQNKAQTRKIALVSFYDAGYSKIGKYADLNKAAYANKHNYSLFIYKEKLDQEKSAVWNKIPIIQKHLADNDWVFWTDADALIMNDKIKIESLIDDAYDIIVPKDFHGINLGNFLVKNSVWSHNFLKLWYQNYGKARWYEQGIFIKLYKNDPGIRAHVKVVPNRVMNAYLEIPKDRDLSGLYKKGDFLIHFAGLENKENLMKSWYLKTVKRHISK